MPAGAGDTLPTAGDIRPMAGDTRDGDTEDTTPPTGEVITMAGTMGIITVAAIITRPPTHITVTMEGEGDIATVTGVRVPAIPVPTVTGSRIRRRLLRHPEPTEEPGVALPEPQQPRPPGRVQVQAM
jgi:hypothetical protein